MVYTVFDASSGARHSAGVVTALALEIERRGVYSISIVIGSDSSW